ncbi:MAG: MarR family transcriptional regulator [Crenarchaeota archaeon]|jgi:DNA-binding IscR family transcriptional regulator|nr:MarR family transcriptional regulator [Thermoproteota archaeon]
MVGLTIIFGVLLITTTIAAYEYYRQICRINKEYKKIHHEYEKSLQAYEKAKNFIEDIVLSFNRELKRESNKFNTMISKVDNSFTTAEFCHRKVEGMDKRIEFIENQLIALNQIQQTLSQDITNNLENTYHKDLKTELNNDISILEAKLQEVINNQESLKNRIDSFENQIQTLSGLSPQSEAEVDVILPSVLIKRDKALATLTETEITVLEMLAREGAKTAPEIKERVHLSREHTSRLMKKIYEEGYVEREVGKIPFRYTIKKEMEVLLKKIEQ